MSPLELALAWGVVHLGVIVVCLLVEATKEKTPGE